MTRILTQRHTDLTLYITRHNEGAGDVYRSERRDGEQIARGSFDTVKADTREWLQREGHVCSRQCSDDWEDLLKQWTHSYADGQLGHIVTRDDGPFFLVVYPPNPPRGGSLPVDAADTLDDAIRVANRIAGQESNRADWQGSAD